MINVQERSEELQAELMAVMQYRDANDEVVWSLKRGDALLPASTTAAGVVDQRDFLVFLIASYIRCEEKLWDQDEDEHGECDEGLGLLEQPKNGKRGRKDKEGGESGRPSKKAKRATGKSDATAAEGQAAGNETGRAPASMRMVMYVTSRSQRDRSFLLYEVLEWSEGAPAKVRQWTPVDGHEGRFELKPGTPTRQDQELRYWTRQNWYEVKHEVGSQAPPQVTLPEQSSQVTAAFQALGASRR